MTTSPSRLPNQQWGHRRALQGKVKTDSTVKKENDFLFVCSIKVSDKSIVGIAGILFHEEH